MLTPMRIALMGVAALLGGRLGLAGQSHPCQAAHEPLAEDKGVANMQNMRYISFR